VVLHQVDGAHHHAGGAEAALQAVALAKAACIGCSVPSAAARPSMVVTGALAAWTASMVQDLTALAVDMHHAGAALAGVAADMGAGQPRCSRRRKLLA
jgi:hypothetical protein